MALKVTRMLVPQNKYSKKCPFKMTPKGICVHNTANKASALSEASYMIRNNNAVSFHVAIDDYRAVECIPENRNAFHAGDGRNGNGNRNYYAVEICYFTGDSAKFTQAEKNAAYYIACKLKEHGWGIERLKASDFSGKYCPHKTLDLGWERFLNLIRNNLKHSTETENSYIYPDGNWGEKTTRITQKVLGTTVDGIVSRQPKVNRTFLPSAFTSSWMFYINSSSYKNGSAMINALQELIGAKADGWFGKNLSKQCRIS